ncbi:alpha/beta fold hydrolase [Clostridium sp. BL-8]|uniref:alpha/beta fold hydrolase n=1 Tax=Clostridium sp. BL-8 TaxID=349938 RepID=UPI00098C576F|nr:alpha/beta fold hydrolase [Clostridium sp. BL-8]OOM74172.1 alpha/beta hydrolase family protein [Clostridium sp. BL-8]
MAFQEKSFDSFNERDRVQAWIYTPVRKPKGIIQIVHGYHEHSRRYLHMILKLNEAGFIVAADDHVGHGKTAYVSDNWSDWGNKGYMTMVEDEHTLRKIVQEEYPDLPYFMFGHSMGSMIVRCYASIYGKEIDGIILCGTPGIFKTAPSLMPELKKLIDEGKGEIVDPVYEEKLLSWMWNTKRYEENPITSRSGWVCSDPDVIEDHGRDIYSDLIVPPNIRSLYSFVSMMNAVVGTEWAEKVPAAIPFYNIAGDKDPVGQYGEGVYATSNWLAETGHMVRTKVYPGYRHEILNYLDIRNEIEDGIIGFVNSILEKV